MDILDFKHGPRLQRWRVRLPIGTMLVTLCGSKELLLFIKKGRYQQIVIV